jgi:hypothetical protein
MDIRISENPSSLHEIEDQWKKLILKLEVQFGDGLDLQAVLMLIGVQELGKGYRKFNKDQKLEVLHIAICTLLEPYGYYKFEGQDEDGYPHWSTVENLPPLKPGQQSFLMKQSIIDYFSDYFPIEQ